MAGVNKCIETTINLSNKLHIKTVSPNAALIAQCRRKSPFDNKQLKLIINYCAGMIKYPPTVCGCHIIIA